MTKPPLQSSNPAYYDRYSTEELATKIKNTQAALRLPAYDRKPLTRELAELQAALSRKADQ